MITLRLDKNGGINKGDIKAFEHDNLSEVYVIQLYKNGAIYDLTNKTVELTIVEKKRKLGDMISLPIYEATEGKVKLEVVSDITKQDGIYDFKLTVKDTTGLIETFPNFQVKIENDITDSITWEIIQDPNFTILTEGLKALADYNIYKTNALKVPEIEKNIVDLTSQLDKKAKQVDLDNANARISNLVIHSGEGSEDIAEIVDGRVGGNSVTYTSLGDNIRDISKGKGIMDGSIEARKLIDTLLKLSDEYLFDTITLTEGYYLDPTDGGSRVNANYGYSDYLEVSPNDKFYCTDTSGLFCKYNYNKELIGGGNLTNNSDFSIDSQTYYIRLSIPINLVGLIKFRKYNFFINARNVLRNLTYYVDKNGNGDFTTIQEAVDMIPLGGVGTVYIADGEYEEALECWGKTVHLIGTSKKDCILFNYNDDYSIPPLEIGRGSVQNMTIKSINNTENTNTTAYAIHIEDNNLYNGNLQIINCRVESGHNYAIGIGLRGGCDVEFNNCELIGKKVYGGLFFHDAINPTYKGEQNIKVKNCIISAQDGGFLMRIQSQNVEGSTVNMEFINNIIRTPVNPDYKGMHFANDKTAESTTNPTDFSILTNFKLSPMSYGNNIDLFNY